MVKHNKIVDRQPKGPKLPECFSIKILQDQVMKDLKSQKVIGLRDYKQLKTDMDLTRYSCVEFIKRQRGSGGAGGSGARN